MRSFLIYIFCAFNFFRLSPSHPPYELLTPLSICSFPFGVVFFPLSVFPSPSPPRPLFASLRFSSSVFDQFASACQPSFPLLERLITFPRCVPNPLPFTSSFFLLSGMFLRVLIPSPFCPFVSRRSYLKCLSSCGIVESSENARVWRWLTIYQYRVKFVLKV